MRKVSLSLSVFSITAVTVGCGEPGKKPALVHSIIASAPNRRDIEESLAKFLPDASKGLEGRNFEGNVCYFRYSEGSEPIIYNDSDKGTGNTLKDFTQLKFSLGEVSRIKVTQSNDMIDISFVRVASEIGKNTIGYSLVAERTLQNTLKVSMRERMFILALPIGKLTERNCKVAL